MLLLQHTYLDGAREGGHEICSVALRTLQFDLVLRGGFHGRKPLEPDIAQQQDLTQWCEHLVVVSPNWWWSAPALLKGYVDRMFLPEFAMRYHARFPYVEPLLTGLPVDRPGSCTRRMRRLALSRRSVLAMDLSCSAAPLRVLPCTS
jgi:putative NADPH-quinone reductase